jgi:hypothetical protein
MSPAGLTNSAGKFTVPLIRTVGRASAGTTPCRTTSRSNQSPRDDWSEGCRNVSPESSGGGIAGEAGCGVSYSYRLANHLAAKWGESTAKDVQTWKLDLPYAAYTAAADCPSLMLPTRFHSTRSGASAGADRIACVACPAPVIVITATAAPTANVTRRRWTRRNGVSRLTGTYRLDPSQSDDPVQAADRATRSLTYGDRARLRDQLTARAAGAPGFRAPSLASSVVPLPQARSHGSRYPGARGPVR